MRADNHISHCVWIQHLYKKDLDRKSHRRRKSRTTYLAWYQHSLITHTLTNKTWWVSLILSCTLTQWSDAASPPVTRLLVVSSVQYRGTRDYAVTPPAMTQNKVVALRGTHRIEHICFIWNQQLWERKEEREGRGGVT